MDLAALIKPFPASEVKFRAAPGGGGKLAYIDARAVYDRLDEVCGPENWQTRFKTGPNGGTIAGIGVRCGDQWVWKWDGAENTKIEEVKGGLSDSIKRAAVQWGVGRYLYKLDKSGKLPKWAIPDDGGRRDDGDSKSGPSPSEGTTKSILQAFATMGAFQKDVERLIGKPISQAVANDVEYMREVYKQLSDLDVGKRKDTIASW